MDELQSILKNYPVIERVKLYGSRAKGNFTDRSDIDLVAYGDHIDRFVISSVNQDFDDSNIPYMIDFQSFKELKNSELIDHINRVGVVIYESSKLIRAHG